MDSNDILAKLLANENLNVVRGNVSTASFNIATRTLVLPQWKNIQDATEEMLILHEVGHALFTPMEYADSQEDKPKSYGHYINVVEDARIERKMKSRYPGSRKSFMLGYNDLIERDFFGINGRTTSDFNLIDRINLYFKLGNKSGIKFSKEESNFVSQIELTDTIDDVIKVADALFAYCLEHAEAQMQTNQFEQPFIDDPHPNDMDDDMDDDMDEQLENGSYEEPSDNEEDVDADTEHDDGAIEAQQQKDEKADEKGDVENRLESSTVKSLASNLMDSADVNTKYVYYKPEFHRVLIGRETVIEYKKVLSELSESASTYEKSATFAPAAAEFKRENASMVSSMVKEFEMRKSASSWKRALSSKTGTIDPKKLFGYKIKEELFKQLTVIKDGEKHGMVFLLDWSGSMQDHMLETIKQVINLAMFARRINIPFQVFAFTNSYYERNTYTVDNSFHYNAEGLGNRDSLAMLELFSDRMSESEFARMTAYLLAEPYCWARKYFLSGTPLNEALIFLSSYLGKFIKNNNVEKMILVTLTDGEGGQLYGESMLHSNEWNMDTKTRVNIRHFLKDPITGKQYSIADDGTVQTSALMSLIKDRYDTVNVGFNITTNNRYTISNLLYRVIKSDYYDVLGVQTKLRANKFMEIDNGGYNHYYIIDARSLAVQNSVDISSVDSTMSASKASKVFGKALAKNRTSRIVLNNFVGEIA